MSAKKRQPKISNVELSLLKNTTLELIDFTEKDKDVIHHKALGFEYYSKVNDEILQVQITVTRGKIDSLAPLAVEVMNEY